MLDLNLSELKEELRKNQKKRKKVKRKNTESNNELMEGRVGRFIGESEKIPTFSSQQSDFRTVSQKGYSSMPHQGPGTLKKGKGKQKSEEAAVSANLIHSEQPKKEKVKKRKNEKKRRRNGSELDLSLEESKQRSIIRSSYQKTGSSFQNGDSELRLQELVSRYQLLELELESIKIEIDCIKQHNQAQKTPQFTSPSKFGLKGAPFNPDLENITIDSLRKFYGVGNENLDFDMTTDHRKRGKPRMNRSVEYFNKRGIKASQAKTETMFFSKKPRNVDRLREFIDQRRKMPESGARRGQKRRHRKHYSSCVGQKVRHQKGGLNKISSFNGPTSSISESDYINNSMYDTFEKVTKHLRVYQNFHSKVSKMILELCPDESEYIKYQTKTSLITLKNVWIFLKDLVFGYVKAKRMCHLLEREIMVNNKNLREGLSGYY